LDESEAFASQRVLVIIIVPCDILQLQRENPLLDGDLRDYDICNIKLK